MVLIFNASFWIRLATRFGISIGALALLVAAAIFFVYFFGKGKKNG